MRGLTPKTLEEFEPVCRDRFTIERKSPGCWLHIHSWEAAWPRGPGFRRQSHKTFERNGRWEFKLIESGEYRFCKTFVWILQGEDDPDLVKEADAIEQMFENYEALGFFGRLLYQNGEPVAFYLSFRQLTMDVHFEALPNCWEALYYD